LDLYLYISEKQSSSLSVKDETYNKIVDHLDEFIKNLPQIDKQLLMQTISKCYFKYQNSITKDDKNSITELNIRLLMAMLLDQKTGHDKA
jgi:hypothetical protein